MRLYRRKYISPHFQTGLRKAARVFSIGMLFCFLSAYAQSQPRSDAQELHYDVIKNNTVIGKILATKKMVTQGTEYTIESDVNLALMVVDFKVYSFVKAAFSGGQLKQSTLVRKVNGKEKVNTKIDWSSDKYLIRDRSSVEIIKEKILYTTACLMSAEPVNLVRIFSENFKKFITVKMVKPHTYELHLPDGNHHTYYYENGSVYGRE